MSPSNFHAMHLSSSLVFQVQVNQVLPSTPSSLKVNAATLNHFLHTPVNSWAKWINRMLISSKVFHQLSLLIRSQRTETLVQQLELSLRSMTTSVSSLRALDARIALSAARRFHARALSRLSIRFSPCLPQQSFRYLHQLSANVRANSSISLQS